MSQSERGPLIATITYCLSEAGRKASVTSGGSGAYHQNVSGLITPDEERLFHRNPEGVVSVVFNQMEFDEPQRFEDLLETLRERQTRLDTIKALIEAEAIADDAFNPGA